MNAPNLPEHTTFETAIMGASQKNTSISTVNDALETLQAQRIEQILNQKTTALLVVDMQNDFVDPRGKSASLWHHDIAAMQKIVPKIEAVAGLFYERKLPVIRVINYEDPEFRTEAGLDRFLWLEKNDHEREVACLKGSWGAKLFTPARPEDIVIEKNRISAYVGTNLHDVISNKGIKTIVVVGVKTQRCVGRTVQDLYDNEPNLHVVVLEDCIASDNSAQHSAMLAELKQFYPPVVTSEDLVKAWRG